jgi:uncharacterized membrane protein
VASKPIDLPRLAALSDGVFAVAMTVLVASLTFPGSLAELGGRSIGAALLAALPQLKIAAISFLVAALYWWRHHDLFQALARCDHIVMWLNFLLLFGVVLMPFATRLLGGFPNTVVTIGVYAGNLVFVGAVLLAIWGYAARREGLLKPGAAAAEARPAMIGLAAGMAIFLASIAIAWFDADLAPWTWLLLVPASRLRHRGRRAGDG